MTLADGKSYVLAPLSLGALEDFSEAISNVGDGMDPATIKTMIDVAHSSLLRNYPKITREEVRELIDIGNAAEVFQTCMGISGLKARESGPGEARAARPKPRRR